MTRNGTGYAKKYNNPKYNIKHIYSSKRFLNLKPNLNKQTITTKNIIIKTTGSPPSEPSIGGFRGCLMFRHRLQVVRDVVLEANTTSYQSIRIKGWEPNERKDS